MFETDPVLGAVVGVYPSDRLKLLLPAAAAVGAAAVVLNFTLAESQPLLTALLAGAVALAAGWWVLHLWNREVVLYENGFTYREGGRAVAFHYAEVRSFRQRAEQLAYFGGLVRRAVYRFTLITIRDERIILGGLYRHIDDLGLQLEKRVYAQLEPAIRDRLAKGERLPFSDTLRLSAGGLHESGRDLPWAEFGGWRLSAGRLILLDAAGEAWFALPLSDYDNVPLLLQTLKACQSKT
jgi:hypothetical protein